MYKNRKDISASALNRFNQAVGLRLGGTPMGLTTIYPLDYAPTPEFIAAFTSDATALRGFGEHSLYQLWLEFASNQIHFAYSKSEACRINSKAQGFFIYNSALKPSAPELMAVFSARLASLDALRKVHSRIKFKLDGKEFKKVLIADNDKDLVVDIEGKPITITKDQVIEINSPKDIGSLISQSLFGEQSNGLSSFCKVVAKIADNQMPKEEFAELIAHPDANTTDRLFSLAKEFKAPQFLDVVHFGILRSNMQGTVDSWITNLMNAIEKISETKFESMVDKLDAIPDDIFNRLLGRDGFDKAQVMERATEFDIVLEKALASCAKITQGEGEGSDIENINQLDDIYSSLADPVNRLMNYRNQEIETLLVAAKKKSPSKKFKEEHPHLYCNISLPKRAQRLLTAPTSEEEAQRRIAAQEEYTHAIAAYEEGIKPYLQSACALDLKGFHLFMRWLSQLPQEYRLAAWQQIKGLPNLIIPRGGHSILDIYKFVVELKGAGFWYNATYQQMPESVITPVNVDELKYFNPYTVIDALRSLAQSLHHTQMEVDCILEAGRWSMYLTEVQMAKLKQDGELVEWKKESKRINLLRSNLRGAARNLHPQVDKAGITLQKVLTVYAFNDTGKVWVGIAAKCGGQDLPPEGFRVIDSAGKDVAKPAGYRWFRICGTSKMKEPLLKLAKGEGSVMGAIMTLKDGKLAINIPFTPDIESRPFYMPFQMRSIMGVDLGVYGTAISVINLAGSFPKLETVKLMANKAPKNLDDLGRQWREVNQLKSQFEILDNDHRRAKQSMVGDLVGQLQRQMYRYRALPVFENEISNLEAKHAMNSLWNQVVRSFCGGETDADTAARNKAWHTSVRIPKGGSTLLAGDYQWINRDGKVARPPFQPGATIGGAYTSDTCPCCRTSGRQALRSAKTVKVEKDSDVAIITYDHTDHDTGEITERTRRIQVGEKQAELVYVAGDGAAERKAKGQLLSKKHYRFNVAAVHKNKHGGDSSFAGTRCRNLDCWVHRKQKVLHSDLCASFEIARRTLDKLRKPNGERLPEVKFAASLFIIEGEKLTQ